MNDYSPGREGTKEQKIKIIIEIIVRIYIPKKNKSFKVTVLINDLKSFVLIIGFFNVLNILTSRKR